MGRPQEEEGSLAKGKLGQWQREGDGTEARLTGWAWKWTEYEAENWQVLSLISAKSPHVS